MEHKNRVIANPVVVLREEYDDWAILFNPDTSDTFGLNPTSVFIFKRLDGSKTLDEIVADLRVECKNVPDNAKTFVCEFVEDLISKGMAEYQLLEEQN